MLIDILQPFCADTGYDIVSDRSIALSYINRAAKEIYKSLEADAIMREVTLVVPTNQQVTLPPYIGHARGMRQVPICTGLNYGWGYNFPMNEIGSPRYLSNAWKDKWTGWRLKGKVPLSTSITNASLLTLTVSATETPNVEVVITGSTTNSQRISETVTMSATSVATTNSFATIDSIVCVDFRTYDITISDASGNELAILYNSEKQTRYLLVDVSQYSWVWYSDCPSLVEVLYKAKFYNFINDTDEFAAEDYEEAIRCKAMEFYFAPQANKETQALGWRLASTQAINIATQCAEVGEQRKIVHAPNPVYTAFRRLRSGFARSLTGWTSNDL